MRRAPSGYQLSRDAFDAIGREKYGAAWTGDLEYRARSGLWTIEEHELAKVTPGSGMSGSGFGSSHWPSARQPARPVEFVAPARPADEVDPSSAAYQAEREARERYDWAEPEFIARLESGTIAAAVLNYSTGRIRPIGREFWRTGEAHQAVLHGIGPGGHGTLLMASPPAATAAAQPKARTKPSVKRTPAKRAAVHQAANALYGSIAEAKSAPTNARDAAINKWLTQQNLGTASSKTIHRALGQGKDK
ncbi:hypothetical protein [Bradyrhizobium elkanii]|uniref:hypothetical protein n=1 Tax=Bradyrhizobium elkanii TaxID=29448 RepID=UPI00272BE844|nr:hypothetical protein [Bradyrhizobium elkanii]WLA79012.1 hypothetical protein QNJ99_26745 [Bradyrhizobium elkanii]